MKNNYALMGLVSIIVGISAFYGGMQFQKQKSPAMLSQFGGRENLQMNSRVPGGTQVSQRTAAGMAPVAGEIISSDEASMTVKMPEGSSKIVLISENTAIIKASIGSKTDLITGEQITVFGTQNQDGSVTAQNISIGGMMFRGAGNQIQSSNPSPTIAQ